MELQRRNPYGWAGTVGSFLSTPAPAVVSALEQHIVQLLGLQSAASQRTAWVNEEAHLRQALRDLAIARPESTNWGLAFEYELLLEGGRRPDVVLHTGSKLIVLEYKEGATIPAGAADQVAAYARDLAEYHRESHNLVVEPVLVFPGRNRVNSGSPNAMAVGASQLAPLLDTFAESTVDFDFARWLDSPYEPLPTLVEAARMIFNEEPLPRIRRAESAGIPEALDILTALCKEAERDSLRVLAFLAGVPGAGKTLAGLQLVYNRLADNHDAVFLSGNGPLVEVLRDALQNKSFVQDLHAFVTTYGSSNRAPTHHVVVFDEAQRAWDRGYMEYKKRGGESEPEVLVGVGERLPSWCSLVGLVGDGQEIHSGEEAGMRQWSEALDFAAVEPWAVAGPPRLAPEFAGREFRSFEALDLTLSLRSRRADDLHAWVAAVLEGRLGDAARLALQVQELDFPLYVTRSLSVAKEYLVSRYAEEPEARYGLLASSRTQRFLPDFGIPSDWVSTKKVKFANWYNRGRGEPGAGANLEDVVTEFGCQGLELDLPLVAWGDDVRWDGGGWVVKPGRPRYPQDDPVQLRINCYRVLLTRGRDGLVVYVPDHPMMDQTEHALLAAGMKPLS